ncbi:MAG: hypothetical protein EOS66_08105 [Mesorhizobium sp.]|nr:MAG: hypothetical protein EOS66_08105 [Mesorhizobium sp.]
MKNFTVPVVIAISLQIDAKLYALGNRQATNSSKLRGKIAGAHFARKQRSFSKIDLPYIAINFLSGKGPGHNTSSRGPSKPKQFPPERSIRQSVGFLIRRARFLNGAAMAKRDNNPTSHDVVKRLVRETGISEAQARDLVRLIGLHWSSLVREAKLIASSPRD